MDNMHFEEEIEDKEYFEEKIKELEERITELENKAIVYGKWPEHPEDLEKNVGFWRMINEEDKKLKDILNRAREEDSDE